VSDIVTAADAARAVLAVAEGAAAVAVVAAVDPDGAVTRLLVHEDGRSFGSLGHAQLDDAARAHGRAALHAAMHVTAATDEGRDAVVGADGPGVVTVEVSGRGWLLYIETHFPADHLVIVGAGHIAVPLAHLGIMLDFRVTVLDDREEFATGERFDDAVSVMRSDFASDPFAGTIIDGRTYVALVTRGHRWDFDCLQRLVTGAARPRYIGMIGSRRRVRAAFHALLEAGTPRDLLASVHAPIGLEIGAETPGEIAVSIAAELTAIRRGSDVHGMGARENVLDRFLKDEA
jgi:xanthine/CO dehydrogenase XdhC/CoxF family maturation factor